jgi:intracellular sulfur oxidation DsrE/DsrF family protein
MDAPAVAADIRARLIPNATVVPAVVGEVTIAQQAGYTLILIPNFTL